MTTLPELPKDSVEEILCRVPATNLKRLRCTSKRWNRLFKEDRGFIREHSCKAAKEFLFLMLTKNHRISPISVNLNGVVRSVEVKSELTLPHFNSNSYQFDIYQVFHCDGLLLCTHDGTPRSGFKIVVWNPFTGQARWIESQGFYFGLGYSQDKKKSCRKSYKILNFTSGTNNSEIYDFDSDSWKLVDHDIAPGWTIIISGCRSVSFKGDIYWISKDLSANNISLLRFDFSTEKSQGLPLPYERVSYVVASLSAVREDKLSALLQCDISSKTEIWVTNQIDDTTTKGGAVSWTKVLALDLSFDLQMTDYGSFLLDEEKKVVVWLQRWLDLKDDTKSIDKIYIVGEDSLVTPLDFGVDTYSEGWPVIFNYVPSFVQVERAQIKRAGDKRKRGE